MRPEVRLGDENEQAKFPIIRLSTNPRSLLPFWPPRRPLQTHTHALTHTLTQKYTPTPTHTCTNTQTHTQTHMHTHRQTLPHTHTTTLTTHLSIAPHTTM